ncbi:hypothetical protein DFQ27_009642, partial [Actinomortierella ambigua]
MAGQPLIIGTPIGEGQFGTVYHAKCGMREVAIKKFTILQEEVLCNPVIQQEIDILERLRDRHIIQFYGTTYHEGKLAMIMDHAENGSLKNAIDRRLFDWPAKWRVTQGIARGLDYIHSQMVIHRDLKSANVLLTKHMEVKLCDFGFAIVKVRSITKASSLKGTPRWMAPELFGMRPKYSTKSDMYALGMVMWEMAANCTVPYKEQPCDFAVCNLITSGQRETLPEDTPADYRAWVERCWHHESNLRPEAQAMIDDVQSETDANNANDPPNAHEAADENPLTLVSAEDSPKNSPAKHSPQASIASAKDIHRTTTAVDDGSKVHSAVKYGPKAYGTENDVSRTPDVDGDSPDDDSDDNEDVFLDCPDENGPEEESARHPHAVLSVNDEVESLAVSSSSMESLQHNADNGGDHHDDTEDDDDDDDIDD